MAAACLCDPEPKNWEIDVIEDKHCVRHPVPPANFMVCRCSGIEVSRSMAYFRSPTMTVSRRGERR